MKSLIFMASAISSVYSVKTDSWTYKTNGADWPNLNIANNVCGTEN